MRKFLKQLIGLSAIILVLSGCNSTSDSFSEESSQKETAEYYILWFDWDGTVLETDKVKEGEYPQYNGITPTRESDEYYDYEFEKWSPGIRKAFSNQTYTAQYKQNDRFYTVTWVDWDGTF